MPHYEDLKDFVDQKPQTVGGVLTCPQCDSHDIVKRATASAMVGPPDRNHFWHEYSCTACGLQFTHEIKGRISWQTVTDEGLRAARVLKGFPACFENYVYTHKGCGGDVMRKYAGTDGVSEVTGLVHTVVGERWVKSYRTFYTCLKCQAVIESPND